MVGKEALDPKPAFEIPTVSEALYTQTREALAKEGYTFVVAINPESISQLATNEGTGSFFGRINPSEKMQSNVPPQIEVAIDPNRVRIEGSKRKSTDIQVGMIKKREAALKKKLPKEVRDLISMIMPKQALILVQLDSEYQKRTGKVLFTNWFGRTDEQAIPGMLFLVGRDVPTYQHLENHWPHDLGRRNVFAVPVVVLPRKLAV